MGPKGEMKNQKRTRKKKKRRGQKKFLREKERSGERFREREKDEGAELHSCRGFGLCGVKLLPLRERRCPRLRRLHRCLHHGLR